HDLRHHREHPHPGGRGHPRLRAAAQLRVAHSFLWRLPLRLRARARRVPLPRGPPAAAAHRQVRGRGGRLPRRRRHLQRLPCTRRVHRQSARPAGPALLPRRVPRPGARLPPDWGLQESHAQAGGVGRAALRRGQAVARPPHVPPARPPEGQHRGAARRGGPKPQALPRRQRLGTAPRPLRRPPDPPPAATGPARWVLLPAPVGGKRRPPTGATECPPRTTLRGAFRTRLLASGNPRLSSHGYRVWVLGTHRRMRSPVSEACNARLQRRGVQQSAQPARRDCRPEHHFRDALRSGVSCQRPRDAQPEV
ncbi:MAG: hypothetical protein AVDCRST_MAG77-3358, partial [uncultured Chloroflexi bacterium]